MFTDIIELREFYKSPRGQTAANAVGQLLRAYMPAGESQTAIYGYAPASAVPNPAKTIALMPAPQGVAIWPDDGSANRAALVEDGALPLPDQSLDNLVLMHALESSGNTAALLRECWRVLKGSGRLLIVVPNRRGLWARAEATPFGRGSPYSATQLRMQLRQAQFVAEQWQRTLFVPPFKSRTLLATAPVWEQLGTRLAPTFGGIIVLAASKQLYAPTGRVQQTGLRHMLKSPILPPPQPVSRTPLAD